jgi:hypothetical protein
MIEFLIVRFMVRLLVELEMVLDGAAVVAR